MRNHRSRALIDTSEEKFENIFCFQGDPLKNFFLHKAGALLVFISRYFFVLDRVVVTVVKELFASVLVYKGFWRDLSFS